MVQKCWISFYELLSWNFHINFSSAHVTGNAITLDWILAYIFHPTQLNQSRRHREDKFTNIVMLPPPENVIRHFYFVTDKWIFQVKFKKVHGFRFRPSNVYISKIFHMLKKSTILFTFIEIYRIVRKEKFCMIFSFRNKNDTSTSHLKSHSTGFCFLSLCRNQFSECFNVLNKSLRH